MLQLAAWACLVPCCTFCRQHAHSNEVSHAVQIKDDNITKLVVIPLYPQFSISTSASSLRLFEEKLETDPALQGLSHIVIASWYWRNGYLEAMTNLIAKELTKFEDPQQTQACLLPALSPAFSVPASLLLSPGCSAYSRAPCPRMRLLCIWLCCCLAKLAVCHVGDVIKCLFRV